MSDKILTQHPEGKRGVNIDRTKYDQVRSAILDATFQELNEAVGRHLEGRFDGSIGWYFTTVKLDLEARGEIERLPGSSPQRIRRLDG